MPLKLKGRGRYGADKLFTAHVRLLDGTVIDINLPLSSKGKECLEKIANKFGLREVDYFGLQFLTKKERLRWVDLDKCLRKQLDRYAVHKGKDALLVFKVQYFAVAMETLQQEITRYLYYLQLKSLILIGRLKCDIGVCLKLAGLAVQAELGDYDPCVHSIDYLSDFLLLPNDLTKDPTRFGNLNKEIVEYHKDNDGLSPAQAEKQYIELCQKLEHYGVEFFDGKDKDAIMMRIGSCYQGIKLFYPDKQKSNILLSWQNVGKMAFNRQTFVVVSIKTGETISIHMDDMDSSKYFWKLCVSQHQFFRMAHNTDGKNAFRTQFEVTTDPSLFLKLQQNTPQIKRRVTLTKRKAKETQSTRSEASSVGSHSPSEQVLANGIIPYPYMEDSLDDTEFLHRYEDLCNLDQPNSRGSSFTSSASTNASITSSDYTTSDSDSEADHRQFHVQPMSMNGPMGNRPFSLIFTRLNKIESEHRDELLKHLQGVKASGEWKNEFDQMFTKKNGADFSTALDNTTGNRINNVLPYEDNRVHLNPNNNFEATNYVNASPLSMDVGNDHHMLFLIAQSPLKHTVNNFWQMIWEHNVTVIGVVSKLQENGNEKCWKYWPDDDDDNNNSTFGQVSVRKNFDNHFSSYTIRSLHVQHASAQKPRTIFQLQYLEWPEDGNVPNRTKPFIEYLDEIQSIRKVAKDMNRHLPHQETLIHCEDGAGRSGVVVLVEVLLTSIEQNETLDIPMTLARLRSQRMNIIQTAQQYSFVYQLLIDYLARNRLI